MPGTVRPKRRQERLKIPPDAYFLCFVFPIYQARVYFSLEYLYDVSLVTEAIPAQALIVSAIRNSPVRLTKISILLKEV